MEEQFKIKGNAKEFVRSLINDFKKNLIDSEISISEQKIIEKFNTYASKFSAEKTVEEAVSKTFGAKDLGKPTYILCYKYIKDLNRFLEEEIVKKQQEYRELQKEIKTQQQEIESRTIEKIESGYQLLEKAKDLPEILSFFPKSDHYNHSANAQIWKNIKILLLQ